MESQITENQLSRWLGKPVGQAVTVGIMVFLIATVFESALLTALAAGGAWLGFEWVKEIILKIFRAVRNEF